MGKKENRVYEITGLLAEEIIPKLVTVRAERRVFMPYQKASAEPERLRKRQARVRMDGPLSQGRTQGVPDRRAGTRGRQDVS